MEGSLFEWVLLVVLGVSSVLIKGMLLKRLFGRRKTLRRLPRSVLIINTYAPIGSDLLSSLQNRYALKELKESVKTDYQEEYQKFVRAVDENEPPVEKTRKEAYERLCRFIESKNQLFPDLVILCSEAAKLATNQPFLLYQAEIHHSREEFSESVLIKALGHYSTCEQRNGK
ncbi:hypothetical protein NEDG_00656 [Nematocida displodere]|uniref:Uncharacterized protein n=1 Tax=Nematocida displodere TaxID=1805483 RepID=A0A177EC39_9MICR|nr:hypothetical protein NEDG_00656 [Nematocida displodere]